MHRHLGLIALLALGAGAACGDAGQAPAGQESAPPPVTHLLSEAQLVRALTHSPLAAPPPEATNRWAEDEAAAAFGQRLFFEPRLSRDGTLSCASCHRPELWFTDGLEVARGLAEGERNTPTVVGVAHARWLFWDGRADSAWSQALGPLENELEMGSTRASIARLLAEDDALRAQYESVFGELPTLDEAGIEQVFVRVGKALGAYERRLQGEGAPFDRFLQGVRQGEQALVDALSPSAQRGLALFVGEAGCRNCHVGPLFSDGEFHSVGIPPRGGGRPQDSGRWDGARRLLASPFRADGAHSDAPQGERARALDVLVQSSENWGQFKTPSLRNVARTAPYMHAGQFASLDEVVHYYSTLEGAVLPGHHGELVLQPLELDEDQQRDLVAFLESLSDESLPERWLGPPAEAPR